MTTERIIGGKRIVRLRKVAQRVGPACVTCYTLSDPFSLRRLIPVQVLETQARLIADRKGWRIIG